MIETGLIEKIISFGGIGILAAVVIWLLKQATSERQNVTEKFLATLETTIKANAEGQVLMAGRLAELAAAEAEEIRIHREDHGKQTIILTEIAHTLKQQNGSRQP